MTTSTNPGAQNAVNAWQEERAAVVAWLRNGAYYGRYIGPASRAIFNRISDAIEAGEHNPTPPQEPRP